MEGETDNTSSSRPHEAEEPVAGPHEAEEPVADEVQEGEQEDESGGESDEESTSDEDDSEGEEEEGEEEGEEEMVDDNECDDEDDEDDEDEEEEDDGSEEEDAVTHSKEGDGVEEDSSGDENCDQCPICLNRLRQQDVGMPESCDHLFCLECIQEWSKNVNTCPVDRQIFHLILAKHAGEDKVYTQFPVEHRQQLEVEEEVQEDDTACEVCGLSDREDRLLLCDSCDSGYHCDCLDPPLASVPVQEWFCPDCVQQRTRDEEPLQHGRQIARTTVSERVRRIIADARTARAERRRVVAQRIADRESFMDEDPTPGPSSSSTPRRRGTKRKRKTSRKTTKKRKTVKKRKTTRKKKTTKKRRKVKRKGKSSKQTSVSSTAGSGASPALARTAQTSATVKGRIADKLGLKPPPRGRSLPIQKAPSSGGSRGTGKYEATPSFSILGTKDELYSFAENECEERVPVHRPAIPASTLSRSALSSHRPLGRGRIAHPRRPATSPATATATSSQVVSSEPRTGGTAKVESTQSEQPTSSFDLLGSIMSNQDLLAKSSRHITIKRDGSLTAASSGLEIHAAARNIKLTHSAASSGGTTVGNAGDTGSVALAGTGGSSSSFPLSTNNNPFCEADPSRKHENHLPSTTSSESVSAAEVRSRAISNELPQTSSVTIPSTTSTSQSSSTPLLKPTGTEEVLKSMAKLSNDGDHVEVKAEIQCDSQSDSNSQRHEVGASRPLDSGSRPLETSTESSSRNVRFSESDNIDRDFPSTNDKRHHSENSKDKRHHKASYSNHLSSSGEDGRDNSSHRSQHREKHHAVSSHINNPNHSPLDSTVPNSGVKTCSEFDSTDIKEDIQDTTECSLVNDAKVKVNSSDVNITLKPNEIKQEMASETEQDETHMAKVIATNCNSHDIEKEKPVDNQSQECEKTDPKNVLEKEMNLVSNVDISLQSNSEPLKNNRSPSENSLVSNDKIKKQFEETPEQSPTSPPEKFYNSTSSILKREILDRETCDESFAKQEQLSVATATSKPSYTQILRVHDRGWSDDHIIYEEAGWGNCESQQGGGKSFGENKETWGNDALPQDVHKQEVNMCEDDAGNKDSNQTEQLSITQNKSLPETSASLGEIEKDGAIDEVQNMEQQLGGDVGGDSGVVKEEGEASDSGEDGEVRDENSAGEEGDFEEGEIVDDDENDNYSKKQSPVNQANIKKSVVSPTSAVLPQESSQATDVPVAVETEGTVTEGKDVEEKEEEEINEEEEEEESSEDDCDPCHPFNGNFMLGAFLASVKSNEFDRKKEKAARKEAIRQRKEEKKRMAEAERIAKENAKISIYDFIGSSAKKFGVFVPTADDKKEEPSETSSKGKMRGTKLPSEGEPQSENFIPNTSRSRAAPWGDRERGGREHRRDRIPTSPNRQVPEPMWRDKGRDYPPSMHNSRGRGRMSRTWNPPDQFHSRSPHRRRRRHSRSPLDTRDHPREKRRRSRSPHSPNTHVVERRRSRRYLADVEMQRENHTGSSDHSESSDDGKKAEDRRRNATRHKKRKWGRYSSEMNGSVSSEEESGDSGGSSNDEAGADKVEPEVDSDEEVLAKRTSPIHILPPVPPLPHTPSPQSGASPMSPPSPPAYSPVGPASPAEPPPPPPSPPRPKTHHTRPVQKSLDQLYSRQPQEVNQRPSQPQPAHPHPHPQHHHSQQYSQAYRQQNTQPYSQQQQQQQHPAQSSQSQAQYSHHYQQQHQHYSQQQYTHAYSQHPQYTHANRPGQTSQYSAHSAAASAGQYSYPHPQSAYSRAQAPAPTPTTANSRTAQGTASSGHPGYHYYPTHSTASSHTSSSSHPQSTATSYQHGVSSRPGYPQYPYPYTHPGYNMIRPTYQQATTAVTSATSHSYSQQAAAAYQGAPRSASANPTAMTRPAYPYSGYAAHQSHPSHHPSSSGQAAASTRSSSEFSGRLGGRVASPPREEARPTKVSSYRISPSEPSFKGVPTSDRIASNLLLDEVKKGFRQLVEDAVRSALKPAWNAKKVTKDEYKDIFKRAVDKVCGSKETVVQQDKIQFLVEAYVTKARKTRTS